MNHPAQRGFRTSTSAGSQQRPGAFGSGGPREAPAELPSDYLQGGYFAADGHIRPELLQETAETVAKCLAESGGRNFSTSQFRRFYDHIKAVEQKLNLLQGDYRAVEGDVKMLKAFAADAWAKEKVPEVFRRFIDESVEHVSDKKSFLHGFVQHLQAVLAYYSYYENLRGRRR